MGGSRAREARRPSASGGPPPLPSEIENGQEPAEWPVQACGRRHDPEQDCGRCGRARKAERESDDQAVLAEAQRRTDEAERRRRCQACDPNGWLEHPETGNPLVRCDHETDPKTQVAEHLGLTP